MVFVQDLFDQEIRWHQYLGPASLFHTIFKGSDLYLPASTNRLVCMLALV